MKYSISNVLLLTAVLSPMMLSMPVLADKEHGHGGSPMVDHPVREVMGQGRINKVMPDRKMVNISHGPISELKWPKMRMNFQVSDQVALDQLEPGQKVEFVLQVDEEQNTVIKSIDVN